MYIRACLAVLDTYLLIRPESSPCDSTHSRVSQLNCTSLPDPPDLCKMFNVKQLLVAAATSLYFAQTALAVPLEDSSPDTSLNVFLPPNIFSATAQDLSALDDCYWPISCPQFGATWDMKTSWIGSRTVHYLRVNHKDENGCHECPEEIDYSGNGCKKFSLCGRSFEICVDIEKKRAHRWIGSTRHCFTLERRGLGHCSCLPAPGVDPECYPFVWHPKARVDCTWPA